uniref:Uncharacterized protein n=1 Tax=Meloidogyne enterolobii TaxID=390850 RepID=A0A6V7Y5C4_MELEN|nr:unnamed protein product [Meloidogyne enterolobii]
MILLNYLKNLNLEKSKYVKLSKYVHNHLNIKDLSNKKIPDFREKTSGISDFLESGRLDSCYKQFPVLTGNREFEPWGRGTGGGL